jgi:ABC-type multidrug transport system ATPase subunit
LVEVEQICTQIAVLRSGRLVFTGTVTEAEGRKTINVTSVTEVQ